MAFGLDWTMDGFSDVDALAERALETCDSRCRSGEYL